MLASLFVVSSASAFTFVADEDVTLDVASADDAYIAGGNVSIDNDVNGDLWVGGSLVTINGNIAEDLVVIGGRVTVWGDVGGDIRVLGGTLSIYGEVGDDVMVGGGFVDIGKDAVVNGSVLVGAGEITVEGKIMEELRGFTGAMILRGTVVGNVSMVVQESILIDAGAIIGGDFDYSAILKTSVPEGVVKGEISFNKFEEKDVLKGLSYALLLQKAISYIGTLLLTLLIVIFAPRMLIKGANIARRNVLKSMGVGVLTVIAGFIGSIVLFLTIVGIPLGLIVFSGMIVIYYLSTIFVAAWLSNYLFDFAKKKKWLRTKLFFGVSLGLIASFLIGLIPIVGIFINIILFLVGVGSIVLLKTEYAQFMKDKKMI